MTTRPTPEAATVKTTLDELRRLGACQDARDWLATQPDVATAWSTCERPDWMLWLLGRVAGPPHSPSRLALVACAADCAETSVQYIRDKGLREQVRYGIALLRRYVRGDGGLEEARGVLRSAAVAASWAADADAAAVAASWAADADAAAVAAARAAAWAAAWAAARDAAWDAADAADAAAYAAAAARSLARRIMADIVRRHYPEAPQIRRKP